MPKTRKIALVDDNESLDATTAVYIPPEKGVVAGDLAKGLNEIQGSLYRAQAAIDTAKEELADRSKRLSNRITQALELAHQRFDTLEEETTAMLAESLGISEGDQK